MSYIFRDLTKSTIQSNSSSDSKSIDYSNYDLDDVNKSNDIQLTSDDTVGNLIFNDHINGN